MPAKAARPAGVRCTVQATSRPVAPSTKTPRMPKSRASASGSGGFDSCADRPHAMSAAIARMVTPSAVCTTSVDSASPSIAPAIEVTEPTSASGIASRRLARPLRRSAGPAESAPESASSRPALRTKSRWNGKNPATTGTNSTPPPTPASTATTPMAKLTAKSASGQIHQATLDAVGGRSGPASAGTAMRKATRQRRGKRGAPIFGAMLTRCPDSQPTSRCSSRKSASSSASPPRAGPDFARSSTSIPTTFPPAEVAARRATPACRWCCTTCRAAMRSAASTARPACPAARAAFREDLERAIEYARAVSCPRLHCLAGVMPAGAERRELHATYVANLRYAAERLAREKMQLLIEPVSEHTAKNYFLRGSAQAVAVLDEVGADNAFLQYDFFHMQVLEGNLAETAERLLAAHRPYAGRRRARPP